MRKFFSALWGMEAVYRPGARFKPFLATLLLSGIAYGLYRGIQDNYLAEIVHINKFERGIVEFFRETPGLLVVFLLAAMYRFSESLVFKIGTAIMLAGVAGLLALGTGKLVVVIFMVVWSFGEHIIMPVKSTISMDLARPEAGGEALGISGSLGQVGNIAGFVVVTGLFFLFSRFGYGRGAILPFKVIFALSTALMAGAVLTSLAMEESKTKVRRRRFYFARKFGKFYMLEVFYGARKQVFLTFAPYVLILQYGADTSIISFLLAISAVFCAIASPFVGRLIDRVGYKVIMVSDTLLLIVVCFFYGFAHRIFPVRVAYFVVCVNYVLDAVISLASMATSVYVKDIAATPQEMTSTLSTGVSVNHVISIFIALAGGWIWARTGIELLFSLSAALGLCNTLYAVTIKAPARREKS